MTPSQLNRLLRQHHGISVMTYLTKQRIEVAKLLLQSSDLPVSEISRLVGFKQLPHFSRTFHAHTGKSPLNFRQITAYPGLAPTQKGLPEQEA
jgi:transcriptional regulator GlxA family with amidase domain